MSRGHKELSKEHPYYFLTIKEMIEKINKKILIENVKQIIKVVDDKIIDERNINNLLEKMVNETNFRITKYTIKTPTNELRREIVIKLVKGYGKIFDNSETEFRKNVEYENFLNDL